MRVEVRIADQAADAEGIDQATSRLVRQLRELDVSAIERPRAADPPGGARGTGLEIAALAVAVTDSRNLASVVSVAREWFARVRRGGSVFASLMMSWFSVTQRSSNRSIWCRLGWTAMPLDPDDVRSGDSIGSSREPPRDVSSGVASRLAANVAGLMLVAG